MNELALVCSCAQFRYSASRAVTHRTIKRVSVCGGGVTHIPTTKGKSANSLRHFLVLFSRLDASLILNVRGCDVSQL